MFLTSLIPPEIVATTTLLLLVMDPLGNVPIFLATLKPIEPSRRRPVILRELLIALGIMLSFLFFGRQFLDLLGLEAESVRISGGVILFVIALRMIFPKKPGKDAGKGDVPVEEPFIVPLAIPLVAGPTTIATLVLMAHQGSDNLGMWTVSTGLAWFINAVILLSAPWLYKILGKRGIDAMERLMGMVLIMLSIQMLVDAFRSLYRAIVLAPV